MSVRTGEAEQTLVNKVLCDLNRSDFALSWSLR